LKGSSALARQQSRGYSSDVVPVNCRLPSGRFCALCCYNTEMPLTEEDIARLEALGYQRSEFAVLGEDGVHRLRNVDGHCFFLDPATGACRVYWAKPEGCRLYPLVYDAEQGRVVVDPECPAADSIPSWVVEKYASRVEVLVEKVYGARALGARRVSSSRRHGKSA